jgi:hypothetical protein
VGNIGVVDFEYDSVLQNSYTIVIDMPITTRLPVSRDDILFDSQFTVDVFKMNLKDLREKWAFNKLNDFTVLEDGLKIYSNYTRQNIAKNIITGFINSAQEYAHQSNKFFVFVEYKSVFDELSKLNTKSYITAYESSGIMLDEYMEKKYKWNKEIYVGKSVMFIDLDDKFNYVTNAGTNKFILIDKKYKDSNQNWKIDISTFYIDDKLYPIGNEYSNTQINNFNEIIEKVNTNNIKVKNQIISLLLKLKSLHTYFDFKFYKYDFLYNELNIMLILGDDYVINYINKFIVALTKTKPTTVYGNNKAQIYYNFGYDLDTYAIKYQQINNFPISFVFDLLDIAELIRYNSKYIYKESKEIWNRNYLNLNSIEKNNLIKFSEEFQNYTLSILNKWQNYDNFIMHSNNYLLNPITIVINYYFYIKYGLENKYDKLKIPIIIKRLIQKCKNTFEWISIFIAITLNYHRLYRLADLKNNEIENLIDFTLTFFRTNIPLNDILNTFPNFLFSQYNQFDNFNSKYGEKITENIIQYINYKEKFKNFETIYLPLITTETHYSFTGTNLMSYFFNKEMEKEDLLKSLPNIQNYKPTEKFPLQALEIAINEGTNKPFIESVLTETVQNSLDAIRTENPLRKDININIYKNKNNAKSIILSIEDYVGIPDVGILSLKIPFLSSKTPSEIVTGEMGSGFFNVYRESNKVIIDTERDGRRVLIVDTPIKSDNRVVDVNTEISVQKTNNRGNGYTKIMIDVEFEDDHKMIDIIINTIYFTKNVIGLIHSDINIFLNGENIKIPLEKLLVNDNKDFEAFISSTNIFSSYIMTKGVPFGELYNYFDNKDIIHQSLIEELRTNVTFNIKHGVYTPVQSRTQLNIKENALISLKKFMLDLAYISILVKINNGINPDRYLPNFTSGASVNQLLFYNTLRDIDISDKNLTISDFVVRYQYRYMKDDKDIYSLGSIINEGANIMGSNSFLYAENYIKKEINQSKYPQLMVDVALKWLENKNKSISESRSYTLDDVIKKITSSFNSFWSLFYNLVERSYDEYLPNLDVIKKFTTSFIKSFWVLGYQEQQNGNLFNTKFTKDPPTSEWVIEDKFLGAYTPSDHSIKLSIPGLFSIPIKKLTEKPKQYEKIVEIQNKMEKLTNNDITYLNDSEIYNDWFGNRFPAPVIIHELEHAWRRNIHTIVGAHDYIEIGVGKNAMQNVKLYEFEDAANLVFKHLVTKGLLEKIKNEMLKN